MADPAAAHLRRNAYIYVRQSTLVQTVRNTESLLRQYDLAGRARELGWAEHQIVVVDDDLGRSGASAQGRKGFSELVADVGLGKAGIVLSLESSRLARNNSDWYQLLDLCALTDTLIADADGVYHPGSYNDRLVLGLKGTLSEAELHLLRSRMTEGLRAKAARGELRLVLPAGLDYDDDDHVAISPDEAVREAVMCVFRRFDQLGSARQVVVSLRADGLRLPRRDIRTGKIMWAQANYPAVHDILIHPGYAGVFAYGRSKLEKHMDAGGTVITRQRRLPRDQWAVMIPGHHPGYISLETYDANIARLAANSPPPAGGAGGAAREGASLAAGPAALRPVRTAHAGRLPLQRQPRLPVRTRQPDVRRDHLPAGRRPAAARDGAGRTAGRARPRLPGRHRPGHVRHRSPVPPEPGRVRTRAGTGTVRSRPGAAPVRQRGAGEPAGRQDPGGRPGRQAHSRAHRGKPARRPAGPPARHPHRGGNRLDHHRRSRPAGHLPGPGHHQRPAQGTHPRRHHRGHRHRAGQRPARATPPGRARSRSSGKAAPAPGCRCRSPPAAATAASPAKTPSTWSAAWHPATTTPPSPRSSASRTAAPRPGWPSGKPTSGRYAPTTASPNTRHPPKMSHPAARMRPWSASPKPDASSASPAPPSTGGYATASSPASSSPREHPGRSASTSNSATGSGPRPPTAGCPSARPPPASASPARPC